MAAVFDYYNHACSVISNSGLTKCEDLDFLIAAQNAWQSIYEMLGCFTNSFCTMREVAMQIGKMFTEGLQALRDCQKLWQPI